MMDRIHGTNFDIKMFQCDGCKFFHPEKICLKRNYHNLFDTDVSDCYEEQEQTISITKKYKYNGK